MKRRFSIALAGHILCCAATASMLSAFAGCASRPVVQAPAAEAARVEGRAAQAPAAKAAAAEVLTDKAAANMIELPFAATPSPALAPLAFLEGRWIRKNPNNSMNEETWSHAYGNSMTGLFRQIRRDGKPALFELSLITVDEAANAAPTVTLRLRHIHAGLEIPEERKELDIFTLHSTAENAATFAGTGKSAGMFVTYRRTGDVTLRQEIDFPEGSKEKDYTMDYVLGGKETFSLTPPVAPPPAPKPKTEATK